MRMFVPKQEASVTGLQPSVPLKRKHSPSELSSEVSNKVEPVRMGDEKSSKRPKLLESSAVNAKQCPVQQQAANTLPTPLHSPANIEMDESEPVRRPCSSATRDLSDSKRESLRQTIQMHLNLEILLKNNELRLIEQELAKSQVALEQLRRCREIQYPVARPSLSVSNGTGPSLRSSFSTPLPASPPAWGIVEGPYSRHYAKWLIPDPRFDGGEPEHLTTRSAGKTTMKSRSMRGGFSDPEYTSNSSRSQRGNQLQSFSAGYQQPKEKSTGPMILKRKSDGVSVKLVCPDCGRSDFGSAQGFINHCRIGHARSFASHDAAAEACGDPVEYDATGAMVGTEPTTTPLASNVHPLIRSATLLPATPFVVGQLHGTSSHTSDVKMKSDPKVSPNFKPSFSTPHLSAFIKKTGLGLDLQDLVADAKLKPEMSESEDEDSDVDVDVDMDTTPASATGGRHPRVAGSKLPPKPSKSPGSSPLLSSRMLFPTTNGSKSSQSNQTALRGGFENQAAESGDQSEILAFNPSPTTESNQAPSLVDDDEEFGPHSPSSSSESEDNVDDDVEVDFLVQDDEDNARESVMSAPEFRPSCAQTPAQNTRTHVRKPSAIRRAVGSREEKHVSFVNPMSGKHHDNAKDETGRDKKKKKLA